MQSIFFDKINPFTDANLKDLADEKGFFILLDKPYGWSSFKAVALVRKFTKIKKCGHAGTLDPYATGLLIIAVGRKATRQIDNFRDMNKTYKAKIKLGYTTISDDAERDEEFKADINHIKIDDVINAANQLTGQLEQIPPIFSAKKIDGMRLYNYAVRELSPEIKPSLVTVFKFEILSFDPPYVIALIESSKGTYIRSLARDMGKLLSVGGYLYDLERTAIGEYNVDIALNANDLLKPEFKV